MENHAGGWGGHAGGARDPVRPYDEDHDGDEFRNEFADEDLVGCDEFGCLFPEECIAPDPYHFPSEWHTAEMMEALYAEAEAVEPETQEPEAPRFRHDDTNDEEPPF